MFAVRSYCFPPAQSQLISHSPWVLAKVLGPKTFGFSPSAILHKPTSIVHNLINTFVSKCLHYNGSFNVLLIPKTMSQRCYRWLKVAHCRALLNFSFCHSNIFIMWSHCVWMMTILLCLNNCLNRNYRIFMTHCICALHCDYNSSYYIHHWWM